MAFGVLGAVLLYVFVLVGSVSIGYLVVRVSVARVRSLSTDRRLGVSTVMGIAVIALAFALDALFGWDAFASANGRFALFALPSILLGYGASRAYLSKVLAVELDTAAFQPLDDRVREKSAAGVPFPIEVIHAKSAPASLKDLPIVSLSRPVRVSEPLAPAGYHAPENQPSRNLLSERVAVPRVPSLPLPERAAAPRPLSLESPPWVGAPARSAKESVLSDVPSIDVDVVPRKQPVPAEGQTESPNAFAAPARTENPPARPALETLTPVALEGPSAAPQGEGSGGMEDLIGQIRRMTVDDVSARKKKPKDSALDADIAKILDESSGEKGVP